MNQTKSQAFPHSPSVTRARSLYNPAPASRWTDRTTQPCEHTARLAPPRIRWLILALLFFISVVTYIDRVNISVTARQMMPAYGMTDQADGLGLLGLRRRLRPVSDSGGWLADRWESEWCSPSRSSGGRSVRR